MSYPFLRGMLRGLALVLLVSCSAGGTDGGFGSSAGGDAGVDGTSFDGSLLDVSNEGAFMDSSDDAVVRLQGVVWSPGADLATTLDVNRFPIPGAAVVAYATPPPDLPQQRYCNECVQVDFSTPHTMADPVNGSFELRLEPGATYYLSIQKGEFRRVREIHVPTTPGEVFSLETASGPKPPETTLPNRTNLAAGDNIPKIAILEGAWENQKAMWEALGFDYEGEFGHYKNGLGSANKVSDFVNSYDNLSQYNLLVAPCGADFPYGGAAEGALEKYVRDGGKLYIDDFSYGYAESVWPDFLSFFVREGDDEYGPTDFVCGDTSNTSISECNDWAGAYGFTGTPGDADFAAWLALPEVNGSGPIMLEGAWDSIHQLGAGLVGEDENGPVFHEPKVWMSGDTPAAGNMNPATVSWPYYCGRVLYTVYHTHSEGGGGGSNYALLVQEKIMMYLIMEIQTCSSGPVVK